MLRWLGRAWHEAVRCNFLTQVSSKAAGAMCPAWHDAGKPWSCMRGDAEYDNQNVLACLSLRQLQCHHHPVAPRTTSVAGHSNVRRAQRAQARPFNRSQAPPSRTKPLTNSFYILSTVSTVISKFHQLPHLSSQQPSLTNQQPWHVLRSRWW